MNKFQKLRSNMSTHVLSITILLMILFGLIICVIGQNCIVNAIRLQANTDSYHMADSAASFVIGDHIDDYLAGEEKEEYAATKETLEIVARKLGVSLLYVIKPDPADYKTFLSVFNVVNNSADNTNFTEWELGYLRETTNDEYRQKYKAICELGSPYETVLRTESKDNRRPHLTTLVPVKNSEGTVTAIFCLELPLRTLVDVIRPFLLYIFIGVVLMVITVSFLISLFLRKAVFEPTELIAEESSRFAREHTKVRPPLGNISQYDIINLLSNAVDSMEGDMMAYLEHLKSATAKEERLGAELSIASSIQSGSLPEVTTQFSERSDFEIYGTMDPAKEVGGDFYDFFFIGDNHLCMMIGDVAGKGIPAALTMMSVRSAMHANAMTLHSPKEILTIINTVLCQKNYESMFVTVWIGILELSTGKLTAANAGHEYPAVKSADGPFELFRDKHDFVIGGIPDIQYHEYELTLEPGAKLFLYTDGIPEAINAEYRLFETSRMLKSLNRYMDLPPKGIIEGVRKDVNEFVGDTEQSDDLTMLCIEIKKKTE